MLDLMFCLFPPPCEWHLLFHGKAILPLITPKLSSSLPILGSITPAAIATSYLGRHGKLEVRLAEGKKMPPQLNDKHLYHCVA